MPERARFVAVGGGVAAASVACHLALLALGQPPLTVLTPFGRCRFQ